VTTKEFAENPGELRTDDSVAAPRSRKGHASSVAKPSMLPSPSSTARHVIWVASYPKSGNTWVQTVIRNAGRPYGFPNEDLDVYKLIAEGRQPQVVGGVRPRISAEATTVLKTHRAWSADDRIHPQLALKMRGFVYVMRNPLDVLLSYINFTRQQYAKRKDSAEYQRALFVDLLGFDRPFSFDDWEGMKLEDIPRRHLDHALARFTELETDIPVIAGTTRSSWLHHCRTWKAAGRTVPGVMLRYEDLLDGPQHFFPLRKIFRFSEQEIIDAVTAVNAAQRSRLAKQVFYNKMTSYYFHDFFSPDRIRAFVDRFADELAAFGYADLDRRTRT
jgi:hypothetical protein